MRGEHVRGENVRGEKLRGENVKEGSVNRNDKGGLKRCVKDVKAL